MYPSGFSARPGSSLYSSASWPKRVTTSSEAWSWESRSSAVWRFSAISSSLRAAPVAVS